ncbi:MAG: hypothetical protein HOB51_02680 [Thaumarchaeota archaeon]|jgi:hypothetical protein|nr:hypothetical protein [Nitrososphaerota archaeon]
MTNWAFINSLSKERRRKAIYDLEHPEETKEREEREAEHQLRQERYMEEEARRNERDSEPRENYRDIDP